MANDTAPSKDEIAAAREAAVEKGLKAAGQPIDDAVQEDYFGFDEVHRVPLPDGVSFVEHKSLTEGARRKYLNGVNREVRIKRASGDATLSTSPGDERLSLLKAAVVGWNLTRSGQAVEFTLRNLEDFLDKASPKIVDLIEKDVRLKNPWLLAEMTVEDIDTEIEALQEMRAEKVKEGEAQAR